MGDREFHNLEAHGDASIYHNHMDNCVCCGGKTEEMSGELGSEYSRVYRCVVCQTRVAKFENMVEVYTDPARAKNVLESEYSQYDWPRF